MKDNNINNVFWLAFIVLMGMIILHFLPESQIFGYNTRQVDMFSEIHAGEYADDWLDNEEDSFDIEVDVDDIVPEGVVMIEDYSKLKSDSASQTLSPTISKDSSTEVKSSIVGDFGMSHFYESLSQIEELDRPVRIAYLGDSFIEGDIMTGDLRAMLQERFGGSGVGFVDVNNPVANLRLSVKVKNSGWRSYSVMKRKEGCRMELLAINQRYSTIRGSGWIGLWGIPKAKELHQDTCDISTIYYLSDDAVLVNADINETEVVDGNKEKHGVIATNTVEGRIGSIRWNVHSNSVALFYGVAMDCRKGVILDNLSMRGNSGSTLGKLSDNIMHSFASARPYDLVVLQYGLNFASPQMTDYSGYRKLMVKSVRKIMEAYPNTSVLIVGVPDRGTHSAGGIVTMQGIRAVDKELHSIARELRCAYWSVYEAEQTLGGIGGMVDAKPMLANRDYTHLTFAGGKAVAKCAYDAIMAGYDNYQRKHKKHKRKK